MNLQTLELKAFHADAVIMATGGPGLIFGKSTNSMTCTGSAVSACYQQGAKYANGEFIQVHPTSIPGEDKLRLMSESARGEGGRVWVPKNQGDARGPKDIPVEERWYFLEEKYPAYGNLVPRDIATREAEWANIFGGPDKALAQQGYRQYTTITALKTAMIACCVDGG